MLQKLLIVPICSITDVDIDSDNYMKRLVSLGLCFTISLILVLGTVFSFSPFTIPSNAFADDTMGGTMGGGGGSNDGNNMPPPQDAPATTDALTAGGGSDSDDEDDENDDNSGGSGDDDNADSEGDKDENNDKDNPQIPEDAPATTDAITAKKIECPPGQEVALFSTSCEPTGAGSQDSTLAATMCPTSPAPTSYDSSDGLLVANTIWEFYNDDYKIVTRQLGDPITLPLHRVATPINPPFTAKDLQSNPGLRAICTGQPVAVPGPEGTITTFNPDGSRTVPNGDGTVTTFNQDDSKSIATFEKNTDGELTVDDEENDNDNDNDNKITPKDLPVTVDTTTVPVIPYRPPAAALPYHGNEIELIDSYDKHDIDAVKKYDTKGQYARFTFNDGTIKEGTYGPTLFASEGTVLQDIKITPGPGTQLDKLGVKDARLPQTDRPPEIHYKDGNVVTHEYFRPSSDDKYIDELAEKITTMNKEGKELEAVYVDTADRRTYAFDRIDSSYTEYKEDGNYIKEWPARADGTQQFYDSKQQKVFVRDANGNVIP